jgi:hypothetical protein
MKSGKEYTNKISFPVWDDYPVRPPVASLVGCKAAGGGAFRNGEEFVSEFVGVLWDQA